MSKQNGKAGDRFERDKSRGGIRNIPLKGDGVGGNILALCGLIDELKEAFETRVANSARYLGFDGFSVLCSRFSELLEKIKIVESDEAQTALQTFWGEVANLFRQRDEQAARAVELDAALQVASEEKVRAESKEDALSRADEFMAAVTERLADYHRRLTDLIKRYKALCAELEEKKKVVEKEKDLLEDCVEAALAEIHLLAMPAALHYANSRCIALERMVVGRPTDDKSKPEIKVKCEEIEKDFRWFVAIRQKVSEFQADVDGLSETIQIYREVEGLEIQKNINDIKMAVRSLHSTFEMVGQSAAFWGCVYGLHEVFDYAPPDLLVYRFNWESGSLPIAEIDKYIANYQRLRQLAACFIASETKESPLDTASESDEGSAGENDCLDEDESDELTEPSLVSEPVLRKSSARADGRAEELGKMVLCVLWAFVEKNIQQAQQTGKTLTRAGDFGRTVKVVVKLLYLVGWIQPAERKIVSGQVVDSLAERGLVRAVVLKNAPTKNYLTSEVSRAEQVKLYLTNSGRIEVVRICDSHRAMIDAVLRKQEEREAAYKTRRGIK